MEVPMPELPHDEQAEAAFLSCCLLGPATVMPEAARLGVAVAHFHDLRHQTLWHHMQALWDSCGRLDVILLRSALVDAGKLEAVGGDLYLMELPDKAPSAHNWQAYWAVLKEKNYRRRVLEQARAIQAAALDPEADVDQLASKVETEVLALRSTGIASTNRKDSFLRIAQNIEEAVSAGGKPMGPLTGYPDLDRYLNGLRQQALYILAARPSVGKSALALNIAENIAETGLPVGFMSLEMSEDELNSRTLARYSGVNIQKALCGDIMQGEVPRLVGMLGKSSKLPIHIREMEGVTINQIRSEARRMVAQHRCGLIVIDYLQLIRGSREYRGNRATELTEVSSGLKGMAKELKVPVLALAQISREVEKENRLPRLSDLRESGSIEQDADVAMFLHHDPKHEEDDAGRLPVSLLLEKNRTGPRYKKVDLVFHKPQTKFEPVARLDW
jgi:replicative DNA helicase